MKNKRILIGSIFTIPLLTIGLGTGISLTSCNKNERISLTDVKN
jgi:hypothetical protein